jgi:uncharacterized protein (DUF2267 family)
VTTRDGIGREAGTLPRGGRTAKAAEDRHISFRWLKHEAALASERDAEAVFRAVARAFGRRIGRGETRHVAAHLPLGLREVWGEETRSANRPRAFERREFVSSVAARLGLETAQAEILVTVVFAWLKHLAPEEIDDVSTILPTRLRDVWKGAQVPQFPPWRNLTIVRPSEPLRVRFVVLEPGHMKPLEQTEGELFQLPARGSHLWRGGRPFIVQRIIEDERTRIVLVPDPVREASVYDDLPERCRITASQRADGTWFARVFEAEGHVLAWSRDEDCDRAVHAAHAEALHRFAVESGYHPESETV